MKKYLVGMLIFGVLAFNVPLAHAVTLTDLEKEVQSLKEEVASLKVQLGGKVLGATTVSTSTTPILWKGITTKSADVSAIQFALKKKGYSIPVADGVYGSTTESAVRAFQISARLPVTGVVDARTQTSILGTSVDAPVSCPKGFTGTYPNCIAPPLPTACPDGWTGTYPNCVPIVIDHTPPACPDGWTGTYPNCMGPSGECPEGWTGTYPNCMGPSGECPEGWTGTYPNCVAPSGCDSNSPSSIEVLSPNGGGVYQAGQQIKVQWKSCNLSTTDTVKVAVGYFGPNSLNPTNTGNTVITTNIGSATVTLPVLPNAISSLISGTYYKINVSDTNTSPTIADWSDNLFTINNTGGFPEGCTSNSGYSSTTGWGCASGPNLISYWVGKVNQHTTAPSAVGSNAWGTDPDGVSGASINKFTYCKKWFPKTIGVKEFMNQTLVDWHAVGNVGNYTGTKMAYSCTQPVVTNPFFPGCTSHAGFSSTTGYPCNTSGSTDPNCTAGGIYSSTTGLACNP